MPTVSPLGTDSYYLNATGTKFGITDGSEAVAGTIGERLFQSASGISITSGTFTDICSIELTPGSWRLTALTFWPAASLVSPIDFLQFYGDSPGNDSTGIDALKNAHDDPVGPSSVTGKTFILPTYYLNVTGSNRTVYLKAFSSFVSGSTTVGGSMTAVRECVVAIAP